MFHSRGVKGLSGNSAGSTQLYTLSDSQMERNSIIRGLLSDVTFSILFKQISTNATRTTEAANRFASTGLEEVISAPVGGDIWQTTETLENAQVSAPDRNWAS